MIDIKLLDGLTKRIADYKLGITTDEELIKALDEVKNNIFANRENRKELEIITGCNYCGKGLSVWVNEDDFWNWQDGELTQVAFPYLPASEREILINHICEDCYNKMFPPEEEE